MALLSLALAAAAGLLLLAFGRPWLALLAFAAVLPLPYFKLVKDRDARMTLFEEQLPDALDVMSRALRAGNPFNEALRVVAEEMDDPIATEFGITFSDLNYGVSVKAAFKGLLERTPNVSIAALVAAVLVQRETGGNMAEILDRIASVLRQRQRFQRRVRTLTAEGRVSAWILVLMPFVLALILTVIAPDYLPMLFSHPVGLRLIGAALLIMAFGIWWIRRIVRVRF
jgi:tight adherence protein B